MVIKKLPSDLNKDELMDSFIQKGGKTKSDSEDSQEEEEKMVRFSLRLPQSLVKEMDLLRKKRLGRISKTLWIIEAIAHYLKEDSDKNKLF
jgi:hypothetical protein